MADIFHNLQIEHRPISDLQPCLNNARTHSKKQLRQIAASIDEFGFTNPVLIDANDRIIAGHGRVQAAKLLGIRTVPVIRLDHLTPKQARAYLIADNKLAENAAWDREVLAIELHGLLEVDLGFDITLTGFETGEIDVLIGEIADAGSDDIDQIPGLDDTGAPVTQFGDLWALGEHRLLCGDALEIESYRQLLGSEKAELVFVDPPYNVKIDGHVSGHGKHEHGEFAMASGEMSDDEFIGFLARAIINLTCASVDGSIHYVCIDWRHVDDLLLVGRDLYSELKNICVWAKTNAGLGSLYRSQHEFVAVFKNGTASHINNVELGRHGRNRTNVWSYPGMNSFQAGRDEALAMHPTVKPVALVEDAILDCSNRGGIVLDAFSGSGTTIIAAHRAGRRGYAIELDPHYVDVTLNRFRDLTGQEPVHIKSGLTFSELS